ncbi:MAG: class I SAM-dependent methyltransferase [Candidatus Bathyarchaeota archaeon]|nr:class I SAM-dependent methyltransferase [Candidatus Bathyarchaeota archaeon]
MTDNRKCGIEHYFINIPTSKEKLGLIKTTLRGKSLAFLTSSSVFSKKRIDSGTRLLIEAMILPETGTILDIGCGYGAVGIAVASSNPQLRVVMTDVNQRAVQLAKRNLEINKVANAEVRCGYLYEPVKDLKFNCILTNPPVSAGMETVRNLIAQAPQVMTEKATFQMVIRSKIGVKTLPAIFNKTFGNCQVLAKESGYRVLSAEKQ